MLQIGQKGECSVISLHPGQRISKEAGDTIPQRAQFSEALGNLYPQTIGCGSPVQSVLLLEYSRASGGHSQAPILWAAYI